MRLEGIQHFPPMDRVFFGQAAADAVLAEAQRLDARRVYLVVSHTLNTTTDEIDKIRADYPNGLLRLWAPAVTEETRTVDVR